MQIVLIIIFFIFIVYIFDTYIKKIALLAICGYGIYKILKWLIYKIKLHQMEKELANINSSLEEIEQGIDNLRNSAITVTESKPITIPKNNYDNMDGHEFEYFCADVLKGNGFYDVEVTQGSGDHGIDILAEKDGILYAIQCKCYSSNIGNSAVQQAHTGKSLYHKDIAVVLTNRYFTQQAIEEAKTLGVKLWDRDKLDSMIKNSIE